MNKANNNYLPVIPDIEEWPIYKLSEDREAFVKEIEEFTLTRLMRKDHEAVADLIAKTIYLELIRIKEEPWKVDPPNERLFWIKIRRKLIHKSLDREEEEATLQNKEILQQIIKRYANEIVGTFKISTFLFARRFLTMFFRRLLNTAASRNFRRIYSSRYRLYERFKIRGAVEEIRSLITKGTVIVVPTHFSNLDSILVGYAMDTIVGLPSFSYGAGLNLYNTGYTAYYMNRLGAYRVDRRKKNPIYLETLKAMSNLSIQRGVNSLFFPGGTRSRSGSLETKLKLGLLGTVVEAQRAICERETNEKIFVVPLIISYHTVLEAPFLIEQHLRRTGKESYLPIRDQSYSFRKVMKFAWKFFSKSSDITLSFGQPFDVLGNNVDAMGESYDRHGNKLYIKDYFVSRGKVTKDLQREMQYTQILANRIVERYHCENIVLSSHLIAFAAFNILKFQNPKLDLYGILRLPPEDYYISFDMMRSVVGQLKEELIKMEQNNKIKLSEEIGMEVEELIRHGVNILGNYHAQKPLKFSKKGWLVSESFSVLYFYHNRLENYELDQKIQWQKTPVDLLVEEEVS